MVLVFRRVRPSGRLLNQQTGGRALIRRSKGKYIIKVRELTRFGRFQTILRKQKTRRRYAYGMKMMN